MYKILTIVLMASLLLGFGCQAEPEKDHLLGHWQVEAVTQDGQDIVGKGFRGTHYNFRKDGIVLSWNQDADTTDVQYVRSGDTLFWVTQGRNVAYMIDSLNADFLQISADIDGINSVVGMRRRGDKEN